MQDGTSTTKTFVHNPSVIQAEEAEEIGVEHLLRDIRDVAVGTLSTRITSQLQSLQGLHLRLRDIGLYLGKVAAGDLPVNHTILGNLQDVFNLLPGLSTPEAPTLQARVNGARGLANGNGPTAEVLKEAGGNNELARAMSVKTNDQLMAIYLSSLIRAITAFHDLIENKVQNRQHQEERDGGKKEEAEGEGEKVNGLGADKKENEKGKEIEKGKDEKGGKEKEKQ